LSLPINTCQFLNTYFDKIFVVSVPRFEQRQMEVRKKLEGLRFDFFWGADKEQLSLPQAIADGIYDEEQTKKNQRQGKALNLGELACALTHKMVYEQMIIHNWQRILIFEDDVLPLYQNLNLLETTIKELPFNWDLLYLGYLKHENVSIGLKCKQFFYKIQAGLGLMKWSYKMVNNMLPKKHSAHLKKAGFHDCTHAYAITLDAAKILNEAQKPVVYRADDLLSAFTLQSKLKAFVTNPKFFNQEGFENVDFISEIKR
jgi:glycosyl transferase, family 25